MLTPTKYMDLDLSVMRISSLIIKLLRKNDILGYSETLEYLIGKIGEDVKQIFIPALNFLFLLGLIKYHVQTDSIEFVRNNPEG